MSRCVLPSNRMLELATPSIVAAPVKRLPVIVTSRVEPSSTAEVMVSPSRRTLFAPLKRTARVAVAPLWGLTVTIPGLVPAANVP